MKAPILRTPAAPPAPSGSGGNVAIFICCNEGALTRCFDLLKVDNDLISKSREMLNRGEHSGG
jgi:hypothetical protein